MSIKVDRRSFLVSSIAAALIPTIPTIGRADTEKTNTDEPPVLKITEVITGDKIPNEYAAYYKVETKTEGNFYIVRRKESINQIITDVYYKDEDKKEGRLFPKATDSKKPVAIVDASGADLKGIYNIYDDGDKYKAYFSMSPLMNIPSHTEVSSNYLLNIDQALKEIPSGVIDALSSNSREVMIAKNVDDLYYWLYPSWKTQDESIPVDPNKPWVEKKDGEWVDNRRMCNTPGMYVQSRILMPQKYIKYGTKSEEIDQGDSKDWLKSLTFHETGHGVDFLKSSLYSDDSGFIRAYDNDKAKIADEDEFYVAYFLKNRKEPFAEITGALMGGLLPKSAARILKNFPEAAEHIRKNVLPKFGYTITPKEIKEKIYPGYLLPKEQIVKLSAKYDYKTLGANEDMRLCC